MSCLVLVAQFVFCWNRSSSGKTSPMTSIFKDFLPVWPEKQMLDSFYMNVKISDPISLTY